jgi:hypothetical protein
MDKFNELLSIMDKQNDEEVEFFIDNNLDLLKVDPVKFISMHVAYYANQERPDKVLQVVEKYKSMPYISMEVEELLNSLKDEVTKAYSKTKHEVTKEDIRKALFSSNEENIAAACQHLSGLNIREYMDIIEDFLMSDIKYKYKTLALFILMDQGVTSEVKIKRGNRVFSILPASLEAPFEKDSYKEIKEIITKDIELPNDIMNATIECLNNVVIKSFPYDYLENEDLEYVAHVLSAVACKFYGEECSLEQIAFDYDKEEQEVSDLFNEFYKIVKD